MATEKKASSETTSPKGSSGSTSKTAFDYSREFVDQAIVGGVELTAEQKSTLNDATGADIGWLLFEYKGNRAARDIDSSFVNQLKVAWCW